MRIALCSLMVVSCVAVDPGAESASGVCGDGTHLEDGVCVVDDASPGDTGSGDDTGADSGTDSGDDTGATHDCAVAADGSAPFSDIQRAVDAAENGDVIFVCPGTYDFVEVERADITLVGVGGAAVTTIDGGDHPAVSVDGVVFGIDGFTLRGVGQNSEPYTSALYASSATVDVKRVTFSGSEFSLGSYVVTMKHSPSTWESVIFEDNSVGTRGVLLNALGASGDPISLTMVHSIFRRNSAAMAMYFSDVGFDLENNLFHANTFEYGDTPFNVISVTTDASPHIVWNNVWYGNTNSKNVAGPWIAYANEDFQNNIIANSFYYDTSATGTGRASYNDFFADGLMDGAGTGNLFIDPHFNDPDNGDFSLDPGFSPCINAGNPLPGYNDPDGSRNDIGIFGGPRGSW